MNSDMIIDGLIAELPDYVAAAQDVVVTTEEEKVKWWCQHVERIPRWSVAVKQILLLQLSSAAAERAFSLLSAAFNTAPGRRNVRGTQQEYSSKPLKHSFVKHI